MNKCRLTILFSLIKSKCLPVLLYGTEVCPMNSADRQSLQFTVNKLLFTIFGAMSKDTYSEVSKYFGIEPLEEVIGVRRDKFIGGYILFYLCAVVFFLCLFYLYLLIIVFPCYRWLWWNKAVCNNGFNVVKNRLNNGKVSVTQLRSTAIKKTSASETIRKPPLAKAQTTIRKQK